MSKLVQLANSSILTGRKPCLKLAWISGPTLHLQKSGSGIVVDAAGNLYGFTHIGGTYNGGTYNGGTLYKLTLQN